ncbi:DUF559 domain-containing protein [Hyalangium sp.]|uniref:DUF559 domain-containing protein n=1 Tax=Hyalangium sp. TaxID=2028555 RepID=UPI003899D79D
MAVRQHGVVGYKQLIALGFSSGAIEHAVLTKRFHRVYRGVYAVGHYGLSREGELMAAVLACGSDALLSHWSAAELWRLLRKQGAVIDVSVAGHRCGATPIRTHRLKELCSGDRTRRDRIPVTSVPRTLLDLAGVATERQLVRAVNQAERAGWLNRRAIYQLLERNPGRKGTKALRDVITSIHPQTYRTRSDLEADFLALCARYGIPPPVVNGEVEGYEVDMHWPGTKLIVELDSYEYHRTPIEFAQDRLRDAYLKKREYEVLRVADSWLNTDPRGVAATIQKLLTTT